MSEIAARNMQRELVDINNIWTWPSELVSTNRSSSTSFSLSTYIGKWIGSMSNTGYWSNGICGSFTSNSVTSLYDSGYAIAAFLDVPHPGSYVFSGHLEAAQAKFRVNVFAKLQNGQYAFLKNYDLPVSCGEFAYQINIEDNTAIAIIFYPADRTNQITITDIIIREGVL